MISLDYGLLGRRPRSSSGACRLSTSPPCPAAGASHGVHPTLGGHQAVLWGAPTCVVWDSPVILPVQWTRGCSPLHGAQSHAVVFRGSERPSSFPLSLLSCVLLTCFTPHPQHIFALWCYQIPLFILYFLHSSPRISHSPISPKISSSFFSENGICNPRSGYRVCLMLQGCHCFQATGSRG